MGTPIVERKEKAGGVVREYSCTLVHRETGLLVVRFVMARGGVIFGTPVEVPPDSVSFGYFWKRRPYDVYRLLRRDGSLIAHRFDALTNMRFADDAVTYADLALDWWVLPDGTIIEEDRDEFDELREAGELSAAQVRAAEEATRQVYSRYRHIIDEVERIEARNGLRDWLER